MVISRFVEFVLVNVKMTNFGDVPVCNVNEQTKVWEDVVNPRGNAYALRNQLKYRSSKKEKLYKSFNV